MANNEIKTNAEIYREQRKERLAKAAKKKSHSKASRVAGVIVKIIAVVLAVALVLFGAFKMLTNVFFVPQKTLTAATYGDMKLTVAEYNYYYLALYNQAVQLANQYTQQYGQNLSGFDPAVDPAEQEYVGEVENEDIKTWADYFKYYAHERGFLVKALYEKAMSEDAKKAGFQLTKEQKEEIDTQIEETMEYITEGAEKADYAINNYISLVCGEGLTEDSYKELIERDSIAQYYLTWYQENEADSVKAEDITKYYNEHRDELDSATIRYFTVSYAESQTGESYTKKEAKARADKFAAEATTEKDFIAASKKYAPSEYKENYAEDSATLIKNVNASSLSSISEKMSDWVMGTKRQKGEIAVFDSTDGKAYYIVLIVSPAEKNTSTAGADVRHLLVEAKTTTTNSNDETVSLSQEQIDKNFKTAKAEAETLLKQWKDAGATEEKFIEFVSEHSDDSGSTETGGLYEDVTTDSNYVPEFLEWSLAPHKKGDTGIVKTDYGYHIMYFVGADKTQKWESDARAAIGTDNYNKFFDGLYDDIAKESEIKEFVVDIFLEGNESIIKRSITQNQTNSMSSYY